MEEKYETRFKNLLNDIDKEFKGLNHYQRARFALDQISRWQQKFNEAKCKIPREKSIDATSEREIIGQFPQFELTGM